MCGIVGILNNYEAIQEKQLVAMADAIGHRAQLFGRLIKS